MEEKQDTIILVDEEGEEEEFIHLETIEVDDSKYVILMPVEPGNEIEEDYEFEEDEEYEYEEEYEEEEDEIVILKVVEDNGEEAFATIEDEEELDRVFEVFMSGYEEEE